MKEEKVRKTYYLKESTVKMLEKLAENQSRKLSTIIDLAIEKVYKKQQRD